MSVKEMAYNIIDHLSEEQLKGFVAMFGELYSMSDEKDQEKIKAFEELEKLHRPIPDIDENKELSEWRTEKYDI
jgi:hypothetical protein